MTTGSDLFFRLSKSAATATGTDTLVKESFGGPQYLDPAIDYDSAGWEIIQNLKSGSFLKIRNGAESSVPGRKRKMVKKSRPILSWLQ